MKQGVFLQSARWRRFFCVILCWIGGQGLPLLGQSLSEQFSQDTPYRELYRKGEYQAALDLIQKEIDARPELSRVRAFRYIHWLSDRADILFQLGRVDEAIRDLQTASEEYPEPVFLYRLATMFRYRGKMAEFRNTLETAWSMRQSRWSYFSNEENFLALAQIAELRGENPKQLLSTVYTSLMENVPTFSSGFVGAGDLAFRRGAYDLADQYYRRALEVDETNLDAYAGLAETYWKSNDSRLSSILDHILQINPHHDRAKAIQIELELDQGNASQALEAIQSTVAINPHALRFRALEAAAYFLLDATEDLQRVRNEALNFNSVCSEIDSVPGRIASRHYRFREGLAFQYNALLTNPDDNDARTQFGLDSLRMGDDETGRFHLELAFAADPYNVQVFNLLTLLDTLDTYDKIQEGSFLIRLPKNESPIWGDEAVSLLDEALQTYQAKYEIALATPVHVQIFEHHDDFMVRSVGLPGAIEFMGICFGNLITMDSPTARTHLSMNWKSVLWHEFVHVITLQKTNNRMPRWLSEGISVYEETRKSPAWGQKMKPEYKSLIESEGLPGVSELEGYFIRPKTPNHMMLGYFLAGEFARFYSEKYDDAALTSALSRIGQGKETLASLAEASHQTVAELDGEFRQYVQQRLAPYQNLPLVQEPIDVVTAMLQGEKESPASPNPWIDRPSPFTDALREGKTALEERRWDDAQKAYEEAFRLFPDYSGEHAPLRQLVQLYEQSGNREKLIETLWRSVEWDPLDFDSCRKLWRIHLEEKDWERVMRAAQLALSLDPFHVETRIAFLRASMEENHPETALVEIGKLMQLDPSHKIDYQLERIQILLRLKETERAKRETILLLEEYPHLWKAQQLLLAISEGIPTEG